MPRPLQHQATGWSVKCQAGIGIKTNHWTHHWLMQQLQQLLKVARDGLMGNRINKGKLEADMKQILDQKNRQMSIKSCPKMISRENDRF